MGKTVNLLGAGIGFISEAIQTARSRPREPSSVQPSSSATPHNLIGPDENSRPKATEAGYHSERNSSDSDAFEQDEAEWELDEMAERVRPPTYEESEALSAGDPEGERMMREEQMIRGLVQMAGPPQTVQKLPYSVIIPQRRPGKKQYGFVRAYAPVLADCGVSQELFLQFLVDWEKTSKVNNENSIDTPL